MFHTMFTTSLAGAGTDLTTVTQRLTRIQVAGARQRCTLHLWQRGANVLGMARRVSCPIVCLLTSVCSAHSLIQQQPSSSNRVLHLHLGVQ